MKTRSVYTLAAVLACTTLIGCTTAMRQESEKRALAAPREPSQLEMVEQTMPKEYFEGYIDGRKSSLMTLTKNLDRYLTDPRYKTGWDDGWLSGQNESPAMRRIYRDAALH